MDESLMSIKMLIDELAAKSIMDIMVPVKRDGKDLVLTREAIEALFVSDAVGRLHTTLDTSGRYTEASGVSIYNEVAEQTIYNRMMPPPTFASLPGDKAGGSYAHYRKLSVTLTATAGGEIVAADLVPLLAGYKACCVIESLFSVTTDASISMTIAAAGGITGPSPWAWATTANLVTNYSPGVGYKATAAGVAITGACAAGQAGANQVVIVQGYYWYEA